MNNKSSTKIWISYDLGINGNYEDLYSWLDSKKAKECGDSLAFIKDYSFEGDFIEFLKQDIKNFVELKKTDRIYIFSTKPLIAKFIFGKRKRAPWEGFAIGTMQGTDI